MISHVNIGITDFDRAFGFYQAVLGELGLVLKFRDATDCSAAWMAPDTARPLLIICPPFDGHPPSVGNGQMVALLAPSRGAVDRAHATALAHGGGSEGEPGPRPQYHPDYYGAYFRDPDGNKLCACRHYPAGHDREATAGWHAAPARPLTGDQPAAATARVPRG